MRGKQQTLPMTLYPPNAIVTVKPHDPDSGYTVMPDRLVLDRRHGTYTVHIAADGYAPADVFVEPHGGGIWWNLLYVHPAFIAAGMIVDGATGAANHLTPERIDVKLSPAPPTSNSTETLAQPQAKAASVKAAASASLNGSR
jgi:hypothetical protein